MGIGPKMRPGKAVEPMSLAEARAAAVQPSGPDLDGVGMGGVPRVHVFELHHTDDRGRVWSGRFKCHVLSVRERVQVGLTKSRMSAGIPPMMLDLLTSNLLEMLAYVAVAVDDAPPWAADLEKLHDSSVLQAIYDEVAAHAARFHGAIAGDAGATAGAGPGNGAGAGVDGEDGPTP